VRLTVSGVTENSLTAMVLAKAELLQSDYYCMETFAAWSKACLVLVLVFPLTLVVTYVKPKGGKKPDRNEEKLMGTKFW